MRTFTVYTERGIYTGIRAVSAEHAKKVVWKQTLGREKVETMTAVAQQIAVNFMSALDFRVTNNVRPSKCCWTCGWSHPCGEHANMCQHPDAQDASNNIVFVEDTDICDKWEGGNEHE